MNDTIVKPWKNENKTYEEWAAKAGSLVPFLDNFFQENPGLTVLELGSGTSTRVLERRCELVISIDIDPYAAAVPVNQRREWSAEELKKLQLEGNVQFICADILQMEFDVLEEYQINVIFFDLGNTSDDKWLYRVAYDRLKANNVLRPEMIILVDNAGAVPAFKKHLEREGYSIEDLGAQCIAKM